MGLDLDLQVIRDWQAQALVTLIKEFEFELLSVLELPEKGKELRKVLLDSGRIVLRCRGGLGRTGLVAARLLVEQRPEPLGQRKSQRHPALPSDKARAIQVTAAGNLLDDSHDILRRASTKPHECRTDV